MTLEMYIQCCILIINILRHMGIFIGNIRVILLKFEMKGKIVKRVKNVKISMKNI